MRKIQRSQIFITGDKHRNYKSVIQFCHQNKTTFEDILIILGDAGFNYYGDRRDEKLKDKLSRCRVTLFCIHGNKENRPQNIDTYETKIFHNDYVYYEKKYPNLLFAHDGGVYEFDGKSAIVLGGAHSVDKNFRINNNLPWWEDEIPTTEVKKEFVTALQNRDNQIDYILTHTVPLKYEPVEMFLSQQKKKKHIWGNRIRNRTSNLNFEPDINKDLEKWLDKIEERTQYQKWYAGHYHTDKCIEKLRIMYHDIQILGSDSYE